MSKHFCAQVISNHKVTNNYCILILKPSDSCFVMPKPGQFYMLQASKGTQPLLKRPFSIFDISHDGISFLFKIRGKGTTMLSLLQAGDCIDVLGPLGTGYPTPKGDFVAVAGGVGIASLYPLLKQYPQKAILFYGARSKDDLILLDAIEAFTKALKLSTDDGSMGIKGSVIESLHPFLINQTSLSIYACGPKAMLKAVCELAYKFALNAYVSVEEHMACGIGACLGCVCKSADKQIYLRACLEGPVFDCEVLAWD